jgi:hypothetical protein
MNLASTIAGNTNNATRKIGSKSGRPSPLQTLATQGLGAPAVWTCPVAGRTPLTSASLPALTSTPARPRSRALQAAINKLSPAFTKPWRDLWTHETIVVASEAAGRQGGLAFTLHLSPKLEEKLLRRGDAADLVRRRINKEFRKQFGVTLPYGFTFEIAPLTGKLHLHGVVVSRDLSSEGLRLLRHALKRAGGKITAKATGRQVDLRPITDGTGWAAYSQKDFDTACTWLGTNKVTFLSDELTRLAKVAHRMK